MPHRPLKCAPDNITFAEVNPAYSAQTCSIFGFVAKANRKSQSKFSCHSFAHEINADVNAARNLESGLRPSIASIAPPERSPFGLGSDRSAFDRSAVYTKAKSLRLTVERHLERLMTGDRVISAKVLDSPYLAAHDMEHARKDEAARVLVRLWGKSSAG